MSCEYQQQALCLAIEHGLVDMVEFLLVHGVGADPEIAKIAYENNQSEIAHLLRKKWAGLPIMDKPNEGECLSLNESLSCLLPVIMAFFYCPCVDI